MWISVSQHLESSSFWLCVTSRFIWAFIDQTLYDLPLGGTWLQNSTEDKSHSRQTYSLGVIIMEMLTGAKGYFEEENVRTV